MIYLKPRIIDGIFKLKIFNEQGSDVTTTKKIKTEFFIKEDSGFIKAYQAEGNSFALDKNMLNNSSVFVTIFIDNLQYKSFLEVPVEIETTVQTYNILYKTTPSIEETSNILLDRFTYFMPRWSTAFKNDVTNFSKITYPFFSNIEKLYYKTAEALDLAVQGQSSYFKRVTTIDGDFVGKITNSEGVLIPYSYNPEASSYNRAKVSKTSLKKEALITIPTKLPFKIPYKPTKLFLKASLNSTIIIRGITDRGAFITETLEFKTLNCKVTKNLYRTILEISSSNDSFTIATYVDGKDTHLVEEFHEIPIFTNSEKNVKFPLFLKEGDYIIQRYANEGGGYEDKNYYRLPKKTNSFFINKFGNIVALFEDGSVGTSLLNKDLGINLSLSSSNNNNEYVVVNEVDREEEKVSFSVDCKSLYEKFEDLYIIVKVISDSGVFYLDGNTKQLVESPINTLISKYNNLSLSFSYKNMSFISVIVEVGESHFQATYREDILSFKDLGLEKGYDELLYKEDGYYLAKNKEYYKLKLEKEYYEIDAEGRVLLPSENNIVTNLKGNIVNV